ncbi:MAG: hypothetical protein A2Y40_00405 [Candidatus Margulisbacteria bacterium GWF2_35_9]|nr:MAG: hypothetical protein A2Y40_00405 [Candidatus Margulisbacteria bacterium GWF2_35_9]
MKRITLLTGLLCASTLLFVGCAQKLGVVSAPAGAETVARLDFSGASGVFIAQENDVTAMSAMGAMANIGTRKAAKKPAALYKVVKADKVHKVKKSKQTKTGLSINDLTVATGKGYTLEILKDGGLVYIDRQYTFKNLGSYEGLTFIKTANDDKYAKGKNGSLISLTASKKVIVHVAYDSRQKTTPAWLSTWTKTEDTIGTTDVDRTIYTKTFKAGTILLGDNGSAASLYNVILEDPAIDRVAQQETEEVVVEPTPEPEVVVEPVVAYNQYDQPVDISGFEIMTQKVVSKYYFLAKVRNLTDGSIFYWLIQNQTGKVYQFGEDINDSSTVSLMFQKESAANEFYKYYYLNTEGRVICMGLNTDSVSKTTLATIKGFDYKRAKIDKNDNVILGTKFIKSDGISDGIGGYEYIDFDGNAAKMYVSKTGAFNYLTTDAIYDVYVDESTKVVSTLLYNVDPANAANSYIPLAHYSLPVLENNGYKYYLENKLSDYTNMDSINRGALLIKYDDKTDIKVLEYTANTVIILGSDYFYGLKDKSTIERIDLDLNVSTFYTTSEYDMTTITYEDGYVTFYGYKYSNGAAIKGVIKTDGTIDVATESLVLPETIEKLIPIN